MDRLRPIGALVAVLALASCVHGSTRSLPQQAGAKPPGSASPGGDRSPDQAGAQDSVSGLAVQPLGRPRTVAPLGQAPDANLARDRSERPLPFDHPKRLERLRTLVQAELGQLPRHRVSLLVETVGDGACSEAPVSNDSDHDGDVERDGQLARTDTVQAGPTSAPTCTEPLVAIHPNAARVPASNAKLFTSAAAWLLLRNRYRFVTEFSQPRKGGTVYVWGTGDPLLTGRQLVQVARQLKARGVTRVGDVVVDESHFGRRHLAPGFESFDSRSRYRPTSGALNLNDNVVHVRVTAAKDRRRPRVDVLPPSDYVKVRKLAKYSGKRSSRARRVKIRVEPRGSIMWVVASGSMGRRARGYLVRRPVYEPALNLGWSLRRALKDLGVAVRGTVRRGRRPSKAPVLVRRHRALGDIVRAVNQRSHNLAAETLVRAVGTAEIDGKPGTRGSWKVGLARIHRFLHEEWGIDGVQLRNGSGLHRRTLASANALVSLLKLVYADPNLRKRMVSSMAVAGRTGTLARRMRDSAATNVVFAKTGTLGNALALSGYVDPRGPHPLAFSLLVNGPARRSVRDRIDRVALLLARYARGLPLEAPPTSNPALVAAH